MGHGSHSDSYGRPFEAILDAAVILEAATGRVLLANQAAATILGFASPGELVGLNPLDHVPDEDRNFVAVLLTQGFEADRPAPAEIRVIAKDGRLIWISVTSALTEHEGERATLLTLREITSEKDKDAALREAEHQYRRLFEAMLDGAVVLDTATSRVLLANQATANMFGFASPQEMVGQNPLDYIAEEDRERAAHLIADGIERGHLLPTEIRFRTKQGRSLWGSVSVSLIEHEGRRTSLATIRDITSERERDIALREAESRYERLFDSMLDGAVVLDISTFQVVYTNRAAAEMFGFASPAGAIGENPLSYIPEEDRDGVARMIALNLEGKGTNPLELRVLTMDRRVKWVSATATKVEYEGRTAILSTLRDITADKAKDAALQAAEESKLRLMDAAGEAITVVQDGKLVYVNPAVAKGAGVSQQEMVGVSFIDFVHPSEKQAVWERYQRILGGWWPEETATIKGIDAKGQTLWSEIREIPFTWQGRPAVMSLIHDITDRVLAEEARKHKEERLRAIVENAWDGIAIFDENFNLTFEGPSIYRMTGYAPEDWVGKPPQAFKIHPDDVAPVLEKLASLKSHPGSTIRDFTVRYQHKDGSWRWIEATGQNLLHDPNVKGLVINFRDITDRRLAEDALRRSQTLLRDTQELASIGGWEYDVERKKATWTDETYRIHEIPNIPTIDHVAESLKCYPPPERQTIARAFQRCLDEGVPYDLEVPFVTFTGKQRWVRTSARAVREGDRIVRVVGNIADITERKRVEDALRTSEERNRLLVENASEVIAVIQDGLLKFINPKVTDFAGYLPEELVSRSFLELIHPDDRQMVADNYIRRLSGEQVPHSYQFRIMHKNGDVRWTEISVALFEWEGRPASLALLNDITARRLAEEALKDSEVKYKRLFESTQTAMEVISMETGLVVLANEATARMFGFASANDLVGEDSMKYLRPEDVGWVSTKMAQAVADKTWQEIAELQVRTKDGRWLWISGMAIQSEYQGKPALLISLLDITSRKHAEQTVRESEEKYRLLTEKTNDVIYTTDLNFNDTYVSPSVERILGFKPEEYLGRSPDQRMTLESLARAQEALLEHLSLEKDPNADPNRTVRIELEFYRKDGSTVWLEHQVSGLRDANGTAIGIHGVARDISERRKAEQALKDSEAIYKRLFENTQTAMEVISGETGLVVLANETTARMFGFASAADLIGVDSMEYLLPEDRDSVATQMAQALADKTWSQGAEMRVRTKDGRMLWINGLVTTTEYRGKPSLLISLIDLTSRKQAEDTLRASEEKYRLLAERINDIIWTADMNLRTTYVSPSVERVLGFAPEERLAQEASEQMTPESFARAAAVLAEHLALEEDPKADPNRTLRIELENYRKDGSTAWLENQVSGIRDASGKLVGLHGVARDITERRKTEQALKESEAKYRLVAESTNDEIWTSDINLNTTYVSPSVEKLLGFTVEERMKQDIMAQMTPESFARAAEALRYHLALEEDPKADPNRVLRIELEYYCKDGSTVWLENQVAGIRDTTGKLVGFHGVARDVTERRKSEHSLMERIKELRCIASISRLAEKPELPIDDFVRETVLLLPPAWQYPDICGARIALDSKEFKTENYRDTEWSQSADIRVDGKRFGTVTVCYLQEMPGTDEGPFLKEERDLINTVADFLGHVIQHRQMEQFLSASETKYRDLFDHTLLGTEVIDGETGKIVLANRSMARIFGFKSPAEMIGVNPLDYVLPEDVDWVARQMLESIADPQKPQQPVTIKARTKDGRTIWVTATGSSFVHEGRPSMLLSLVDVTDRVKVQEALEASETHYRNLFEHTLLGMEVVDIQTLTTVLANRSLARMFGFKSVADMIGTRPLDYVLPEDLEWVANQIAQVIADPSWDRKVNIKARTEDGRDIWVTGMAAPFEYEGKAAILISLVDITAAKQAEDKVRESEEKNRLLIENAAEAIAVIQDGVAKFVNRRLVDLTGWPEEELLSKSFLDLVHPDEREMVALNYMKRIGGEDVPNNYQFRIVDKDGNTKWLQVSAVRFDWEGKPATLDMFSEVTERVKAEQALRDSEERFRALVEKATDAVAVLDAAGNVLYYTPSMERATGYGPGEWVNKSLSDLLIHPDDLPKLASLFEELLKEPGASVENFTTRYQHRDGSWHVLEATARNMLHDPKINGVVANFRDITGRVRAEQALKESEERYRLLAENATDIIWVADLNLRITYASPAATKLLGYTIEEVTDGSFLNKALTPESLALMARVFADDLAVENRTPGSWRERIVEIEVVSKGGPKHWLEAAISGIRDPEGRLAGFQGACRDITDRKKAEELLRASEERFRGLVETSSDWVWETDRHTRYTYVSPKVRDILGYEPAELLGRTPFELMHQREGRRVSKIVKRFAAGNLPFSLLENTCTHKDGHSVVLETSAVPILSSDGSFLGYRGMDRDITERKKVEQELQHSLKRLEKTMESTIEAITNTIETRDPYTTGHQMRVTDLACAIAKVMEIPPTQIEGIRVAGLLHDIGKIAIPTEILSKPGKLNEVEYEMIKTHSKVGYNILKKIEFPWPVARTVLQHHERWNGSGYPHGIRGEDILLEARILAVADVMEAMSSHRPYRPSIGVEKALEEISNNRGIKYDPAVADACVTAFTQAGFKFAPSLGGAVGEPQSAPLSHSLEYLEDH